MGGEYKGKTCHLQRERSGGVCQFWKGPLKKQGCTRVSFYLKDAPADETGSAAKTDM